MRIPRSIQALRGWLHHTKRDISNEGAAGAIQNGRHLMYGSMGRMLQLIGKQVNFGTPVFDSNWDVLIVLDGCRYDLFDEVSSDYSFIESLEPIFSVASASHEWMEKTFDDERFDDLSSTAYITANPFSSQHDLSRLATLDEVWRYAWDDRMETIPPRAVTDRAIFHGRDGDYQRMIVHYMQPHYPFIPNRIGGGVNIDNIGISDQISTEGLEEGDTTPTDGSPHRSVWKQLRAGNISEDEIWPAYRDNLKYVLDDVALLLENLDSESPVITADHGNALGEWGVFGHLNYVPVPAVKRVPWGTVTASDSGNHKPDTYNTSQIDNDVSSQLDALGYM